MAITATLKVQYRFKYSEPTVSFYQLRSTANEYIQY